MSSKNAQGKKVTARDPWSKSPDTLSGDKALILSVYLEEKTAWEKEKNILIDDIKNLEFSLRVAIDNSILESKWKKIYYKYFLRRDTRDDAAIKKISQDLSMLKVFLERHMSKEPQVDMYELALYNNKLFSAR